MFLLLTRVLLWLLIGTLVYFLLVRWIPKQYLAWLGGLLLFVIMVMAFYNPNERLVSSAWNILSFPLKPLGLSIMLLLFAIGGVKKGGIAGVAWNQLRIAFFVLLLSSLPIVAYWLAQQAEVEAIQLEQRRQLICQTQCPADITPTGSQIVGAIVVLGRGTTQPNLPYRTQIQLTDTGDRILYAAQLYQEQLRSGNDPLVIVSAGPRPELTGNQDSVNEANDVATLLVRMGVPRNRIVIEPRGVDLRTSAVRVEEILRQRGIRSRRILLVASGLNIRRANLTFANMGVTVIPRATDFYTFQSGATPARRITVTDFVPTVEALVTTTRVVEEYLTFIYYFLRGWLTPLVL